MCKLPLILEQLLFSRRVECLGAGVTAAIDQPHELMQGLSSMLNSTRYSTAAQAFAHRYHGFDAQRQIATIIDRVEQLLNE